MKFRKVLAAFFGALMVLQATFFVPDTALAANPGVMQTVSLGGYHSAVIKADGSLWMWGKNENGQLGNGSTTDSTVPIWVMNNVVSVGLGFSHSAALKSDGTLWMWGNNVHGQLGTGITGNCYYPTKVMDNVASVSLGAFSSCAVKNDGTLWVWGDNEFGQLGDGTTTARYSPVMVMNNVMSASMGWRHSAALKNDGTLWLWGDNSYGQLGTGTAYPLYLPTKVMDDVIAADLGDFHSAAIKRDGSLWLWGDNEYGKIGNGNTYSCLFPVHITSNVTSVDIGAYHSAAVKNDGSLWVWGLDEYGQIGIGDEVKDTSVPTRITNNVVSVSVGDYHTAAIKNDGTLWVWGRNENGQLGHNAPYSDFSPTWLMSGVMLPSSVAISNEVEVKIPEFKIYVNDVKVDNRTALFPFIVYKDVTYIPMTAQNAAFIGLATAWSESSGFSVYKSGKGSIGTLDTTGRGSENKTTDRYVAAIAGGIITVNGKTINNAAEEYPVLNFRDTCYFPLVERFANEFGITCHYMEAKGLLVDVIKTGSGNVSPAPTPSPSPSPAPGAVKVTIPNFRIYINGSKVNPQTAAYPFIVYNGITYFPMTYHGSRFLGLRSEWTASSGLSVSLLPIASEGSGERTQSAVRNDEAFYYATLANGTIRVNGKYIKNETEQYPLLNFREVTYFPLTWRFCVDEFGWSYSYTDATGLEINSF